MNSGIDSGAETLWPRYAALKPALLPGVSISARTFRRRRWYLLHDGLSGKHTRINAPAREFISRLDGSKTLEQVRLEYNASAEDSLSPGDVIALLAQLQQGALLKGVETSAAMAARARAQQQSQTLLRRLLSPLAVKVPLLDPDALLSSSARLLFPFFGRAAAVLWCLLMLFALLVATLHWSELKNGFFALQDSTHYLLLIWLVYPLLKTVHEFSHAIMVKRGGGEVHEMGITLLVFTPVPYVDASAAWLFRSKWQRMMVSAVGIMAELLVSALALLFWAGSEAGMLRDLAFVTLLTGSVSTLVFNANPLLKFDGYYVLQDWLEIPNLYRRSQDYLLYLCRRYLLGVSTARSPAQAPGEAPWFALFAIAALIYRNIVMLFIAFWLLGKMLLPGLVILLWVVSRSYLVPLYKALRYLLVAEELAPRRVQRLVLPLAATLCLSLLLTQVPLPHSTRIQGSVWLSDQAQLYAAASGEVVKVFVEPGQRVASGDTLLLLAQPELQTRIDILRSRLSALEVRAQAEKARSAQRSSPWVQDIQATRAELALALQQQQALTVSARLDGIFAVTDSLDLAGRYFRQGELIGHIVDPQQMVVQVAVPEHQIGAVNAGVVAASVRLAERPAQPLEAFLSQQTPSASKRLPSAVLGSAAGGGIAIAAGDKTGTHTRERVFHLELSLARPARIAGVGERAFVSLQHQPTPLAQRILKSTRQLFLRHLPDYAG